MDIGHVLVSIADVLATESATIAAKNAKVPELPSTFSQTERVIAHMMRENTGASILDSGGAYGRSWERNLVNKFWEAERATVEFYVRSYRDIPELDTTVNINLFHYLSDRLTYERALTRQFRKFCAERNSRSWLDDMSEFPEWIGEKRDQHVGEVWTGNSCNEDNLLGGTIQYTMFSLDCEQFVALQIHGGCDLRGGYTEPKIFSCEEGSFGDWNRACLAPDYQEVKVIKAALKERAEIQPYLFPSLRANNALEIDSLGRDVYWDVGSYEDHGEECAKFESYPCMEIEDRSAWKAGTICVLPDGVALCPITGARLTASFL